LTPAQRKTLDAIVKLSAGGVHPTFRDVLEERKNRSLSSIHRNIHALARQGYIVLGTSGRIEGVVVPKPIESLSDDALDTLAGRVAYECEIRSRPGQTHRFPSIQAVLEAICE
jgi:SOS-response transcriptional repressor LexA